MRRKLHYLILFVFVFSFSTFSQVEKVEHSSFSIQSTKKSDFNNNTNSSTSEDNNKFNKFTEKYNPTLGMGLGLDYGGFMGVNLAVNVHEKVNTFIGLGTNLDGIGFNIGGKIKFGTDTMDFKPFFIGMLGNNMTVTVPANEKYNRVFYGPSIGIGFDYMMDNFYLGNWSFAVIIPFRSNKVNKYITELREDKGVVTYASLYPVLLSIGYKFNL